MARPGSPLPRVGLLPVLAAVFAVAHPLAAGPVAPAGPEIQVVEAGAQEFSGYFRPHVAVFPDGGFVVVWGAVHDQKDTIRGRLFDASGTPQSGELQLLKPFNQLLEGVVALPGGFVVLWQQSNQRYLPSVFAAIFDRRGALRVPPFKVHENHEFQRTRGRIAATPDGGFAVAWMGDSAPLGDVTNHQDVFARTFDAGGRPRTAEILAVRGQSIAEGGVLEGPFIAGVLAAPDGSLVLVMDGDFGEGPAVSVARLGADGRKLPVDPPFPETLLGTAADPNDPAGAIAADGSFTYAISTSGGIGCCLPGGGTFLLPSAVVARRYDAAGTVQGGLVKLNFRGRFEFAPLPVYLPDGSLVVLWTDRHGRDGDGDGVYGRAFAADGTPFGPDFLVNLTTVGNELAEDVAATPDGGAIALYVVVRSSTSGDSPLVARFLRAPQAP